LEAFLEFVLGIVLRAPPFQIVKVTTLIVAFARRPYCVATAQPNDLAGLGIAPFKTTRWFCACGR
jgi:hypothetical protein